MNLRSIFNQMTAAILPSGVLLFLGLVVVSCSKNDGSEVLPKRQLTQIDVIRTIPNVKAVKPSSGGNFSDPSAGASGIQSSRPSAGQNFGGPSAGQNYATPSSGLNTASPSTGWTVSTNQLGIGGGTFSLDGETYELDIVFCAGSLFNPFEDLLDENQESSVLIGLAFDGDIFDLISSNDDDAEDPIFEGGICVFIADANPDGNYDVVAFDPEDGLSSGDAFVFAFLLEDGATVGSDDAFQFYVSLSGGSLSVTNGAINISDLSVVEFSSEDDEFLQGRPTELSANLECSDITVEDAANGGAR
jgi:hypothetical protein